MGKILVRVFIKDTSFFKTNVGLGSWDKYGAAEELDYSLPKFPKSKFVATFGGEVNCKSTKDGYAWATKPIGPVGSTEAAALGITAYPCIAFYDVDKKVYVGKLQGTPVVRGSVETYLKKNVFKDDLSKKIGWGVVALFAAFFVKSKLK